LDAILGYNIISQKVKELILIYFVNQADVINVDKLLK